jgi:hypothetical protein
MQSQEPKLEYLIPGQATQEEIIDLLNSIAAIINKDILDYVD